MNTFQYSFSNGLTDRIINESKGIKHAAYGLRNFYPFRSRIYRIQGLIFSQYKKNLK
ncbi:hypothetical protein [Enterococcus sp. LJL51]|uniref:hypothetical protein n=1 Tax=Enterococcus sp. LJL51 TaxID=3416656 RepID=UPI003CF3F7FE